MFGDKMFEPVFILAPHFYFIFFWAALGKASHPVDQCQIPTDKMVQRRWKNNMHVSKKKHSRSKTSTNILSFS